MSNLHEYTPIPVALAEAAGYLADCVRVVRDEAGVAWALHARTRCRWVVGLRATGVARG